MEIVVQGHAVSLPGVALLGVVFGFVAGVFGVGGGFLLTPLLNVVFGVPLPVAVGTGLGLMVGTSVPALLRHREQGQGDTRFGLIMLAGSLLGVDAGARTLDALAQLGTVTFLGRTLPTASLFVQGGYVALLATTSVVFWRQGGAGAIDPLAFVRSGPLARLGPGPRIDLPGVPLRDVPVLPIAYLGLFLGFLAGLLGIGGGVALLPILIYGYGFPLRQAAGTGIVVLVATASLGTFLHALRGHVHLSLVAALLMGASLAAQVGVLASRRLPVRVLRRSFAVLLVVTAATIVGNVFRGRG